MSQIWHALKSVSHSNLLFLAALCDTHPNLKAKISSSQSQQHSTGYGEKKNSQPRGKQRALLDFFDFFFRRVGSWQRRLPTTSHSSPPGANDTALRLTASRQFSITSLSLLLSQQAETTTMKLQTSLSCKMSTLKLQSTLLMISMMECARTLLLSSYVSIIS